MVSPNKQLITFISSTQIPMWKSLNELWTYGALLLSFSPRDIRIQHSQTYLVLPWALIRLIPSILLLSFVLMKVEKISSELDIPQKVKFI